MNKPADSTYHWDGDALDLDAYLTRIGFDGERTASLATLRALQYAHTTTIPFENLEAVFARPVPLDLESLQDKILRRRRGGYCYEHVGLFAAALERLGFGVTGLHARVSMGAAGSLRPATHAVLRVTAADDERIWLCDVGFGAGPLAPLELNPRAGEVTAGEWRFRLERGHGELGEQLWTLHHFARDGWIDRHSFTLNPQYRIDYAVGNHFVSTSPRSPFVTRPYAQRFLPDVHHILDGITLTTEYPDGTGHSRELAPSELPKVLAEVFDIEPAEADAERLATGWWIR
ncbi:arylamine N-acetyltransferase [Nocardia sp. CDC159]|uniref:Arylamine N-acetyltransferase n=1 Tax=Nocardia pulmonis TaxID=2951408 RepID=A0A9X2IVI1_9NOCA|nr:MULTISPECIES: arylamine N-acetyltransferase [Nocardia]MCM6773243.1 arylamine N-acetyltransferase [Nocardia pulmonis]MCM6786130.1 arylamine N-acetyltransferase [Nocardia sp. CDC159]